MLNGDVDNYADLTVSDGLAVLPEITTDAKVIPTLMSHGLADGRGPAAAFRETVARLEGSVAIGAATTSAPDRLFLALRGSGQALYVGLAEDAFIVASEPYGVVEETSTYLRMDGETPADPDNPTGSRGQIVELVAAAAGTVDGIIRRSYDGTDLPVTDADLSTAQITTRDIDRGPFPHFLLKEITDAPGVLPQDPAGQAGRDRRGVPGGARSRHRAAGGPRRPALGTDRAGAGDRPGHGGGGGPEPGAPPRPSCWPRRRSGSRPCPPPSCPGSASGPTCPTRWPSRSASPAPPPTPTGPWT